MIKQGKNTIYCDSCKAEIPQTKDLIETKHLSGGIQINFFRCKNCGVKCLVGVTDKETRWKQMELNNMKETQKFLIDTTDKYNLEEREQQSKNNIDKMDRLQAEIKEAKAELKKKYEGEL